MLALFAVLTGVMLVSLHYSLVATYGSGSGGITFVLAVIPIGAALLAASVADSWGRVVTRASFLVFTVILVTGMVAAGPLGERARDRQTAETDRNFSCNGPNAGAHVDERVDAAFHEFAHPAPLYGPIEGSRYGCTAGISGPSEETFGAWRDVLLTSGWTVAENGARVRVTRDGLVVVLSDDGSTALLRITADEPTDCNTARANADEGEVVGC